LKLDDGALDRLLSKVDQSVLVRALQGADQPVYERIGQRLPPQEFDEIAALIDGAGPVRLADIDAAQEQLLTLVRP
jgi:flagellar motor switch protein FliG